MKSFLAAILSLAAFAYVALPEASGEKSPPLDVVIVSGQSNAVGFDAKAADLPADPDDAKILFWWRCGDPPPDEHDSTSARKWTTLRPQPVGNAKRPKDTRTRQYGNFSDPAGGFGPEIGLARYLDEIQPDRKLAVIKVAFSGTGIRRDWNPDDKTGDSGACYRALISEVKTALSEIRDVGKPVRLRAFVWIQGESDANSADAPRYADALTAMIAAVRADLEAPEMKTLLAVNTQFGGGANTFMPRIVEAQKSVATGEARTAYVDTAKASVANKFHYDTRGTLDVGMWLGEALLELER